MRIVDADAKCLGCHKSDFDHYMEAKGLSADEAPAAFAAWMNAVSGWDGPMTEVRS